MPDLQGPILLDAQTLNLGGGGLEGPWIPIILYTTAGATTPMQRFETDKFVRAFIVVSASATGSAVLSFTQETLAQIFSVGGFKTQLLAYARSIAGSPSAFIGPMRVRIPANIQTWLVTEVSMAVFLAVSD